MHDDPEQDAMPPVGDSTPFPRLVERVHAFDDSETLRAEVIGDLILLSPAPPGGHAAILNILDERIAALSPDGLIPVQNVELLCPAARQLLIPDLIVLPCKTLFEDFQSHPPGIVELVCEVTSPASIRYDRHDKRIGYATENIPLYLLVDRQKSTVTLFSHPRDGDYRKVETVEFGQLLPLPEPFMGPPIDSSGFPPSQRHH